MKWLAPVLPAFLRKPACVMGFSTATARQGTTVSFECAAPCSRTGLCASINTPEELCTLDRVGVAE